MAQCGNRHFTNERSVSACFLEGGHDGAHAGFSGASNGTVMLVTWAPITKSEES